MFVTSSQCLAGLTRDVWEETKEEEEEEEPCFSRAPVLQRAAVAWSQKGEKKKKEIKQ